MFSKIRKKTLAQSRTSSYTVWVSENICATAKKLQIKKYLENVIFPTTLSNIYYSLGSEQKSTHGVRLLKENQILQSSG